MILYQVQIQIASAIEPEWLDWMKKEHVPKVLATGLITRYELLKSNDQPLSYQFNYWFNTADDLDKYLNEFAKQLRLHPEQKFPGGSQAIRKVFTNI